MNRSELVLSPVHADGNLNLLSGIALEDSLTAATGPISLDFAVAEGTEVELVCDPDEDQPFRIKVNGTTEEAHADRAEAEIAFGNLVVAVAEANREAQYQEDDRRAGR